MSPHNDIAWRNFPGNDGFEPTKDKWTANALGLDLEDVYEGVEAVNLGETPTHCNAEIYKELAGMIRVLHGIVLAYPKEFDTRFVSYNTEIGFVQITGTTATGFQFADTGDYTSRKYFALPSSGIVGGGSDLPASLQDDGISAAALRVWNTTFDAAVEIKFVSSSSAVGFAGIRIQEETLDVAIWDPNQVELEVEAWPLTRWDKLDDLVAFWDGRPSLGGYGTWFMNVIHASPITIFCTSLVPTGDFAQAYCLNEFLTLDEDQGIQADIAVTKSGVEPNELTRFDMWYDDGGGVVYTSLDLDSAPLDTLGGLATALEARGENWQVDVEADSDLNSNLLLASSQESVIARARMAYLIANISAGAIPRYRLKPTDWLYIDDPNSFANGRRFIISGSGIDHDACTADVLGGPPADKVLFRLGVESSPGYIWAKVVSVSTSFVERGWSDLWSSEEPQPELGLASQLSRICAHQRLTGFNIRWGAAGDDRLYYELEDDYSNWLQCIECTFRNASNTTPESSQTCFMKFHKAAAGDSAFDDWLTNGFILTGNDAFQELEGCSGGPNNDRCPNFLARSEAGAKVAEFYSDLLAGGHLSIRMPVAIPEPEYNWESGESIASLVGQPRDQNSFLNEREHRWRISGGLGALPFPDNENDGWYFQLYWNSKDNDDTANLGQLATQLGADRLVPRYAKWVSNLSSIEFGATLLPFAQHVLKSSWSAVKAIFERWGAQ